MKVPILPRDPAVLFEAAEDATDRGLRGRRLALEGGSGVWADGESLECREAIWRIREKADAFEG